MRLYTCMRCLRSHTRDELILGKYRRVNRQDTRNVQFCAAPGCKGRAFYATGTGEAR